MQESLRANSHKLFDNQKEKYGSRNPCKTPNPRLRFRTLPMQANSFVTSTRVPDFVPKPAPR